MNNYETILIINPNLSSKVDSFIKDFEKLCADEKINIIDRVFLNKNGNRGQFTSMIPNLLAVEGVYLLEK